MPVKVGDTAPEFTLLSQSGTSISLKDFRAQKSVVLYFYPKDDTPGCTKESCEFRDFYEVFKAAGRKLLALALIPQNLIKNLPLSTIYLLLYLVTKIIKFVNFTVSPQRLLYFQDG